MKNGIPPQIILLLTLLFGVWGCGGEKASRPKDSIACVGGECLTERDLEYRIPEAYREKITLEEKKGYVRSWIENEILYQEAKNERFDQDKRIQSLLNQRIRETIVQEFVEAKLKDKIRISPDEVERYFQQNQTRFVWEDNFVRISHIFTKGTPGISLAEVMFKQGNKFEDVASQISEDERTKRNGGDIGLVRVGDLSLEISDYVLKLKTNEISSPIHTSYGYEIIKVTDRKQKGDPQEFEWAKEQIVNILTSEYRQREIDKIIKPLSEKMIIKTFDWASDVTLNETK